MQLTLLSYIICHHSRDVFQARAFLITLLCHISSFSWRVPSTCLPYHPPISYAIILVTCFKHVPSLSWSNFAMCREPKFHNWILRKYFWNKVMFDGLLSTWIFGKVTRIIVCYSKQLPLYVDLIIPVFSMHCTLLPWVSTFC